LEKKAKLHQDIISKLDLSVIEMLSPEQLKAQLHELTIRLIDESSLAINEQERLDIITDLQNEILGLGPLEPLLADQGISEIMVNGYRSIFIERRGKLERSNVVFDSNQHLMKIIDKIVTFVGRRIDESSPMVDARLPDGSRVNAIIPPLSIDGPALTIRRFATQPLGIQNLIENNSLTNEMALFLKALVNAKINILISGGTGSGKTTLLNILSSFISDKDRIITIEDTAELQLQQTHVVRLETRPENIEGKGYISMRTLLKNSLRMRPNRIVVGEVRGDEVIDMLQAMNTGHDGSLTTLHANTPRDAIGRLENLMSMAGAQADLKALRQQIASSIQVIIQSNRMSDGSRKITSISEISGMEGEVISMQEIFKFIQNGVDKKGKVIGEFQATGIRPKLAELIESRGYEISTDIFDPN
jgi:pilus assembly protein CpaF